MDTVGMVHHAADLKLEGTWGSRDPGRLTGLTSGLLAGSILMGIELGVIEATRV